MKQIKWSANIDNLQDNLNNFNCRKQNWLHNTYLARNIDPVLTTVQTHDVGDGCIEEVV